MTRHKNQVQQASATRHGNEYGFSLIELLIVCVVLVIVAGAALKCIALASQRSRSEQTKVDLTQEGREFVDEFERDIHQAGYPGCRMFNNIALTCVPGSISTTTQTPMELHTVAMGLVYVSNTEVVFEGDVNGDGAVESVWYRLVDLNGNYPPSTNCPCTLQRSEEPKDSTDSSWPVNPGGLSGSPAQPTFFSQQLNNVINSGVPTAGNVYGNGLSIAGNTLFANGTMTNDAYYAAVTTFKDYPLFSAYDQYGNLVNLPKSIMNAADQPYLLESAQNPTVNVIKSIRLTINLLGSGTTGYDMSNYTRPVATLVGSGRINNNF